MQHGLEPPIFDESRTYRPVEIGSKLGGLSQRATSTLLAGLAEHRIALTKRTILYPGRVLNAFLNERKRVT